MITLTDIENWLRANINDVVKPAKFRDNDWPGLQKIIERNLGLLDEFYGKCCHVTHFLLFYYGGKEAGYKLKISKPKTFYTISDATSQISNEYKTTHWWLEDADGLIIDLTASQFDKFDVAMGEFYTSGVGQDIGFPFYVLGGKNGKRWEHYEENVPSRNVLELGRRFKEEFGSAGGLDWWIEEFDRLEARKQNGQDKVEVTLRKHKRAIKNKIKIRKQYNSTVRLPELKEELKVWEIVNDRHYRFRREESKKRKESQERKNSRS